MPFTGQDWRTKKQAQTLIMTKARRARPSRLPDFKTLYPDDSRVAPDRPDHCRFEGRAGSRQFSNRKFYEKRKKWNGALVYYNEVSNARSGLTLRFGSATADLRTEEAHAPATK